MTNEKQSNRLTELLRCMEGDPSITCPRNPLEEGCNGCKYDKGAECDHEARKADHLIKKGVIVPPCMVGDTVYYLNKRPHIALSENTVYKAEVVRIVTTRLGTALVIQIKSEGCCEIPDVKDWGTAVFATKEEAEEALKGGVE